MRFIGYGYNERPVDPSLCLATVAEGWSRLQCSRKPLAGKLRCKQHETKDAPIGDDNPTVARVTLGQKSYTKLQQHGWYGVRDKELVAALDRIAELEATVKQASHGIAREIFAKGYSNDLLEAICGQLDRAASPAGPEGKP